MVAEGDREMIQLSPRVGQNNRRGRLNDLGTEVTWAVRAGQPIDTPHRI